MKQDDLINSEKDQDNLIKEACIDSTAFARLYRLYYEKVFRYCSRRLFNRHTAEDVTSIVFFKVMKKISSFKGNSNDFNNWVYRIATNAVNDHLRTAKKRALAIKIAARDHGRGRKFGNKSENETEKINLVLKQAVLSLKPKYQTVITLRYFEKMKLTEIAEILEQNPATIRSRLSRALSILQKTLADTVDLEP